ncbi:MAG: AAA family ATPase [Anaerolineae bacterium]|nr:MAG: AAA family ATPase [Anaerolineae bacterium]
MTQFLFFSGKGGVGKTSMACTTAVRYADEGERTLIVTTDPASNLADVFEQPIGHQITPIEGVSNLWAMEIDADKATEEYKDRALAPLCAAFPPQMVAVMEEQMSGPCTAEVAAFDRFTDFLESPANGNMQFDVVIFDTAPTGHTLRLIELPVEWSRSIEEAEQGSGQTCMGPAAIQDAKRKYEQAVATMRNPQQWGKNLNPLDSTHSGKADSRGKTDGVSLCLQKHFFRQISRLTPIQFSPVSRT